MGFIERLYYYTKSKIDNKVLQNKKIIVPDEFDEKHFEYIDILDTVKNYYEGKGILLDIGTYKGWFSYYANQYFKFDKTLCVEPNKELFKEIEQRLGNINNVIIDNIAFSKEGGSAKYYYHRDPAMNSIVKVDNKLLKDEFPYDNPEYIRSKKIDIIDLDTYSKNKNILGKNIFLKIDTQGNELNILNSGKTLLQTVQVCIIEYMFTNPYNSDYTFLDLINFMVENNFTIAGPVSISKRPSNKVSAVDFIFFKN